MAGIKYGVQFEVQANLEQFFAMRKLEKIFPELRAQMLGYVGKRGKAILFYNFLRGQELNYKNRKMRDKLGRRTVNYQISKRASAVKIRSYPANFWERDMERRGKRYSGKYIITRKFKRFFNSRLQGIINDFDKKYLQGDFDKLEKELSDKKLYGFIRK